MKEKAKRILTKGILTVGACTVLLTIGQRAYGAASRQSEVQPQTIRVYYTSNVVTQSVQTTLPPQTTVVTTTQPTVVFPLDLNCASAQELQALPGIGAVLAERIVAYRESCGGFVNRSQLLEVSGIGEKKLADIYDLLYLEEEQAVPQVRAAQSKGRSVSAAAQESSEEAAPAFTGVLDLNTATAQELAQIPGVNQTLAEEIVTLRETIQYFSSAYELLYAEHMTPDLFESIQDYVTVNN